jgi:hypothetical protein
MLFSASLCLLLPLSVSFYHSLLFGTLAWFL